MASENEIKFTDVKFNFEFTVYTYDGSLDDDEGLTVLINVDCGEGIEDLMKTYLNKQWANLFDNHGISEKYISHVEFVGIRLSAKDDKGNKLWGGSANPYIVARFNMDYLNDNNAKKIQEIKKVINGHGGD